MYASVFVLATVATLASSLAVPRATPPKGWANDYLESYDVYHTRYLALSCQTQHNTQFFDDCCHPLLSSESLAANRKPECDPASKSTSGPANDDGGDDDDCDDEPADDDDNDGGDDCDDGEDADPTPSTAASSSSTPVETPPAPPVNVAPAPTSTEQPSKPVSTVTPTSTHHTTSSHIKSTTSTAAAHTTSAASSGGSSNSGSVHTGGFATFFYQNGVAGACGAVHQDSDFIAAIDEARYGNSGQKSSLCGQKVSITNTKNNKKVTVTIVDDCPTCNNGDSIDLSVAAFEAIATQDEGMVPIKWEFS